MTKSRKSLLLSELMLLVPLSLMLVLTLVVTSVTHAQSTNTLDTDKISATFVAPVVALPPDRNTTNTSSQLMYVANSKPAGENDPNRVLQIISVRTIDKPIDLNQASLDFYATQAVNGGMTLISRRDGNYNGHLSTYVKSYTTSPDGKIQLIRRCFYILVSPTEVIIIMQSNISTNETASDTWDKFTDSLVIK